MTRGLPQRSGSARATLQVPRPIVLALEDSGLSRTTRALAGSGLAPLAVFDRIGLQLVCARLQPPIAILDLDLPWTLDSGEEISKTGVRVIAVSDDEVNQLRALRRGFVEALSKDLSPQLLNARIQALISLPHEVPPQPSADGLGKLRIDALARVAYWDERFLSLAKGPFDLLRYLADRAGSIVPRNQLMRDFGWVDVNALHQAIAELRKGLGPEPAKHIENRRGYGYGYRPFLKVALSQVRGGREETS